MCVCDKTRLFLVAPSMLNPFRLAHSLSYWVVLISLSLLLCRTHSSLFGRCAVVNHLYAKSEALPISANQWHGSNTAAITLLLKKKLRSDEPQISRYPQMRSHYTANDNTDRARSNDSFPNLLAFSPTRLLDVHLNKNKTKRRSTWFPPPTRAKILPSATTHHLHFPFALYLARKHRAAASQSLLPIRHPDNSSMAQQLEDYVIQKRLAAALFGDVLLCVHKPSGDLVAVKRVLLSAATARRTLATDKRVRENVALERALYHHFQAQNDGRGHENVLHLREEIEFDGYLYMVFDYCDRGELYELVSASADGKLDHATTRKYTNQIAKGVQFVHRSGYAHRDLSLENVLVTKDDVCQVCDFGLAALACKPTKETVGKMFYMAPEVYAGVRYDPKKADVWSLGVMLFIMLIGAPPVESASTSDARFRLIVSKGIRKLIDRWGLTNDLPAAAIDLVEGMLEVDPAKRFSIDMVVNHAFLKPSQSVFRRMQSSFSGEVLVKQPQVVGGLDAATAASSSTPTDAPAAPRRQGYIKKTINRLLRRRSSKRIMAVPPQQPTTATTRESMSSKSCADNACAALAA